MRLWDRLSLTVSIFNVAMGIGLGIHADTDGRTAASMFWLIFAAVNAWCVAGDILTARVEITPTRDGGYTVTRKEGA